MRKPEQPGFTPCSKIAYNDMLKVHLCKKKKLFQRKVSDFSLKKKQKYFLVRFMIKLRIKNLKNLVQVSTINSEKQGKVWWLDCAISSFRLFADAKRRKKPQCQKTKDEIRPCKKTNRRNPPREKTKFQREKTEKTACEKTPFET